MQVFSTALTTDDSHPKRREPEGQNPRRQTKILRLSAKPKRAGPWAAPPRAFCDVNNACHASELSSFRSAGAQVIRVKERRGHLRPTSGTMQFLLRLIVFFYVSGIFTALGQKEEESTAEVKIEVLHRPENCSKTSKKGDLLNAHYDGYLAKDGSKFYCR